MNFKRVLISGLAALSLASFTPKESFAITETMGGEMFSKEVIERGFYMDSYTETPDDPYSLTTYKVYNVHRFKKVKLEDIALALSCSEDRKITKGDIKKQNKKVKYEEQNLVYRVSVPHSPKDIL